MYSIYTVKYCVKYDLHTFLQRLFCHKCSAFKKRLTWWVPHVDHMGGFHHWNQTMVVLCNFIILFNSISNIYYICGCASLYIHTYMYCFFFLFSSGYYSMSCPILLSVCICGCVFPFIYIIIVSINNKGPVEAISQFILWTVSLRHLVK